MCRLFADGIDPISEATAVRAAVQNLECTGICLNAVKDWRKLPDATHTLPQLKSHFNRANKERQRHLTASDAGFAGAATVPATTPNHPVLPPAAPLSRFHYCWSHGLGPNRGHTSATCRDKAPGHQTEATVDNMLGGCNSVHRRCGEVAIFGRPPVPPTAP